MFSSANLTKIITMLKDVMGVSVVALSVLHGGASVDHMLWRLWPGWFPEQISHVPQAIKAEQ